MSPRVGILVGLLGVALTSVGSAQPPGDGPKAERLDVHGDALPDGATARLGTHRLWQPDVKILDFSPDGTRLVTVSDKGILRIWDAKSGKEIRRWEVPKYQSFTSNWTPLAFSPDGRHLALACFDKFLRVWEPDTAREVMKQEHPDLIKAVAFSPDGKALAAISGNRVSVSDTRSGKLLSRFEGKGSELTQVAYSPEGTIVIAVGKQKENWRTFLAHSWDVTTGKELTSTSFESASPFAHRLSPDGRLLVIPDMKGSVLRRWDTATGKELPSLDGANYPSHIAFSRDGKTVTATSYDGRLRVWDSTSGRPLHEFAGHSGEVERVALSADGKLLASTTSRDQGIHLWHVAAGKELHPFQGHRGGPLVVSFSPGGDLVLTTNSATGSSMPPGPGAEWSLRRWDVSTGKELNVWVHEHKTEVLKAVFAPRGHFLATANSSGRLRLADPTTGKEEKAWQLPTKVVTLTYDTEVKKFDTLTATNLQFSPEGETVGVTNQGKILLWETASGKQVRELAWSEQSNIGNFCFFPDGKTLLAGGWTGLKFTLVEIDVATGGEVRTFAGAQVPATLLTVTPGGHTVAAMNDPKLYLYEKLTGQSRGEATVGGLTYTLVFSPDGRLLATGGRDGVVRLWNPLTGRLLHQTAGLDGEVSSLAFSRDGRRLVSGVGNTALVWDVSALLREAKPAAERLAAKDLETLWADLGSGNARDAALALGRLTASAETSVTFLEQQLGKPPAFAAEKIDKWVAELDSDDFAARENASRQLEQAGGAAEAALKKALLKPASVEAQRRLEKLLERLGGPPAAWLQARRGLEALEWIGDRPAREALGRLAKEAPDKEIRENAKLALQRLERRE